MITAMVPQVLQTQTVDQVDCSCSLNDKSFSFYSEKYMDDNNMDVPPPEWENNGCTRNIVCPGDTVTIEQIVSFFAQMDPVVNIEYVV